jgi:glucose uptake protein
MFLTAVLHALYGNNDPMTIPGSYLLSLILFILTLLCWSSWANTLKLAGPKWRFELLAYDFALGVLIAAAVAAMTFGTLGLDGFTVMDDLRLAGKRQDLFAFMAGSVFSLANILLLGAISLAGMAVAFPVCFGVALVAGVGIAFAGHAEGSPLLSIAGTLAIVASVVFAAAAWKTYSAMKSAAAQVSAASLAAERTAADPGMPKPKSKKSAKKKASPAKALFLAIAAGLLMASYYPLVDLAQFGENGLGPYSTSLIFAMGVVFSTFVCNLFFMNLPVQGRAVEFSQYFTGEPKQHGLGILGGAIWCIGLIAALVASRAEGTAVVGPKLSYAIESAAAVIAAGWGLMFWKEFRSAEGNVWTLLGAMFLFLVLGIGAVSFSPLHGAH